MRNVASLVLILAVGVSIQGQQTGPTQSGDIPELAIKVFRETRLDRYYEFSPHLKPTYLTGDFDGDGKPDIAILVIRKSSKKIGIAVCHSSTNKVFFIGAGTQVGNGGDNLKWMDIWRVTPKATAARQIGRASAALLKGDALHVEKSESASALIYWNGRRYVWRQQGD
jgi:hypothetical protein